MPHDADPAVGTPVLLDCPPGNHDGAGCDVAVRRGVFSCWLMCPGVPRAF